MNATPTSPTAPNTIGWAIRQTATVRPRLVSAA
jgi:hypothetical protein